MASALDLLLSQLRRDMENAEAPLRSQLVLVYESAIAELEHDLFNVTWLIEDALSRGEDITPDWLYRQDRYQRLIAKAETQMARFTGEALPTMERTFQSGARLGAGHATPLLEAAGIQASFGTSINTPAVDKLYQMMFTQGSPLREVLEGYGPHVGSVIRHEMGQAVVLGKSPREAVRNITRALASGENRARLTTLVRTEHMRAYRLSQQEQLEPYAHAIKAYRWSAALQSRTCLACLAMDGELFDEPQTKMHPNCRCICVPQGHYTPERYKRQSGADWLAQQPEATQRGMFPSQAAYEAYKRGELPLNAFVGEKHSDVWGTSITQLSGKQAMANAGIVPGGGRVSEAQPSLPPHVRKAQESYERYLGGTETSLPSSDFISSAPKRYDTRQELWEPGEILHELTIGKKNSFGFAPAESEFQDWLAGMNINVVDLPTTIDFKTFQHTVDFPTIQRYVNNPDDISPRNLQIFRLHDEHYIWDGNHRIAAAYVRGDSDVAVNFLNVDDILSKERP